MKEEFESNKNILKEEYLRERKLAGAKTVDVFKHLEKSKKILPVSRDDVISCSFSSFIREADIKDANNFVKVSIK